MVLTHIKGKDRYDCTCPYEVSETPKTIGDFLGEIKQKKILIEGNVEDDMWGWISLNDSTPYLGSIYYSNGNIKGTSCYKDEDWQFTPIEDNDPILDKPIKSIKADGGYTRMDFDITY